MSREKRLLIPPVYLEGSLGVRFHTSTAKVNWRHQPRTRPFTLRFHFCPRID
jgi:hypothetical protein